MFMPICTVTGFSPTLIVILPLRYQPSEPVENSLTSADMGMPLMTTSTGLAPSLKSLREIGQVVFAAMKHSFGVNIPVAFSVNNTRQWLTLYGWMASPRNVLDSPRGDAFVIIRRCWPFIMAANVTEFFRR